MIAALFVAVGLIGLIIALRRSSASKSTVAFCEYYVYLEGETPPPQHLVFRKIAGAAGLLPGDALLLSDVRLHIGVVLRQKNPHLFSPDFLEDASEIDEATVLSLAKSRSLVIVRFASVTQTDERFLRVTPRLALAFAELGGGNLIYDSVQHRIFDRKSMERGLLAGDVAANLSFHVRIRWTEFPEPYAQTSGLKKKGLPELKTYSMETDERTLVERLVEEAAGAFWRQGPELKEIDAEYLGGRFKVLYEGPKREKSVRNIRLMRMTAL